MGSIGKSLKKVVKKVMRPKVLIPLALMAATGGMGGLTGLKTAALGAKGATASQLGSVIHGTASMGAPTAGWLGAGGKLALGKGTLAKGIMSGLANPLSKKGLATYGGLAALGMGMLGDKPEKAEDPIDRKALNQANYNLMRMYGQNAGYTNEDINTIYGPLGEMMGGGHTEVPADPSQRRRIQFPGTNYPIYTTQGAANGGRIGRPGFWLGGLLEKLSGDPEDMEASENDPLRMTAEEEAAFNQIRNTINYMNANNLPVDPTEIMDLSGANLSDVDRELMQERVDAYLDPEQKANGGRIGLANGGGAYESWKDFVEPLMIEFPELEGMSNEEQVEFLRSKGMIRDDAYATGGRIHRNIGGIMNAPAVTTPGQAMMPPKGTQWDGRQGGFMPMGEAPQADDVPAMLSKDEFVMTRDAVKAAGNGDVNKGAQVMYDLMNNLEAKV